MARSIYVPLEAGELALLAAMAKAERRDSHDQAAHLISEALKRWHAEQTLEGAFGALPDGLQEVA